MQTFVPYGNDLVLNARCLDTKRLVKQCLETVQILYVHKGITLAWKSHPIVNMWRGFESALARYGWYMCLEYEVRFDREYKFQAWLGSLCKWEDGDVPRPVWLSHQPLLDSHRMALRFKDPEHYKRYFPTYPMILNYMWYYPVAELYYYGKLSKPETVVWL